MVNSGNYTLPVESDGGFGSAHQGGWRWCRKCQGLWYSLNTNADAWCPSGQGQRHTSDGSNRYVLRKSDGGWDSPFPEDLWHWCHQR